MIALKTQKFILKFLIKPLVSRFCKVSVIGQENLINLKGPLIIANNHKSTFDPVILGYATPLDSCLLPLRFMADFGKFKTILLNLFYYTGPLKLLFHITGCFPAIRGKELRQSLFEPLDILKNEKGVIVIFPEGQRIDGENLGRGRRGAAALALMSGAPILPIAIKNSYLLKFYNFWKQEVIINIGKPFIVSDLGGSSNQKFEKETEYIMEKIKELYSYQFAKK